MISQPMKSCRIQIVSLILTGLISMPAHAGVIPGRWEKVSALHIALPITVELQTGERIKGQFRGLSPSDLELLSSAGRAVIPKTDIQTITVPWKDGVGDGAWKGAVTGTALFGGLTLLAIALRGTRESKPHNASVAVAMAGFGAGIGAGIGAVADAAVKPEDIVVYKAPESP